MGLEGQDRAQRACTALPHSVRDTSSHHDPNGALRRALASVSFAPIQNAGSPRMDRPLTHSHPWPNGVAFEVVPKSALMNGVTHDIAHHAQSGLSWLYPHLGEACRDAGVLTAAVDLVDEQPYPPNLQHNQPLALALISMKQTLAAILEKHGFDFTDLTSARLEFTFPSGYGDGSLYSVRSMLVYRGRTFERLLPILDVR